MDLFKAFGIHKMPPKDPNTWEFAGHTLEQGKSGQNYGMQDAGPHLNASEVAYQNAHLQPTIVHGRIGTDQPQHHAWIEFEHPKTGLKLVYDPKTRQMGTHQDMYKDPLRNPENEPQGGPRIVGGTGRMPQDEGEWATHPLLTPRHRYSMGEVDILYSNRADQLHRDNIEMTTSALGFPFSREERSTIPRLKEEDDNESL